MSRTILTNVCARTASVDGICVNLHHQHHLWPLARHIKTITLPEIPISIKNLSDPIQLDHHRPLCLVECLHIWTSILIKKEILWKDQSLKTFWRKMEELVIWLATSKSSRDIEERISMFQWILSKLGEDLILAEVQATPRILVIIEVHPWRLPVPQTNSVWMGHGWEIVVIEVNTQTQRTRYQARLWLQARWVEILSQTRILTLVLLMWFRNDIRRWFQGKKERSMSRSFKSSRNAGVVHKTSIQIKQSFQGHR